jgi:hypothetical protein
LKWVGKRTVAREWLIIEVIVGIRRGAVFEKGSVDGVEFALFVMGLMK